MYLINLFKVTKLLTYVTGVASALYTLTYLLKFRLSRYKFDSTPLRCSTQEACEKWEEPQHFNTHLDQCLEISVMPSNMSVTSPPTQVRKKKICNSSTW